MPASDASATTAPTLRITYSKSAIGYSQRQKDTIASLGLKRLGQTVERPDTQTVRGMVHHVRHLVTVEHSTAAAGAEAAGGAGDRAIPRELSDGPE